MPSCILEVSPASKADAVWPFIFRLANSEACRQMSGRYYHAGSSLLCCCQLSEVTFQRLEKPVRLRCAAGYLL